MTGKEGPLLVPRGVYVCAACHAPVRDVVVGRRKVLGAYVPVWGAGPCENPDCPGGVETAREPGRARTARAVTERNDPAGSGDTVERNEPGRREGARGEPVHEERHR